jgi:hypothetical protein
MHATEQLAELIRRKHRVLTQLHEAGRRQAELVAGGDIGSLLSLLAAKQELIAALQTVEQTLMPFYADNPEERIWNSPGARARCAELAGECNALLAEIVRLEQAGAARMTARRDELAAQLQQIHSAAQVRGAYEAQRNHRAS